MTLTKFGFKGQRAAGLFALLTLLSVSPAFAGITGALTKGVTILNDASAGLLLFGIGTVTIAVMFIGYRMMFRSAQWADLAPIFWGAIIVGSAATLAGLFF